MDPWIARASFVLVAACAVIADEPEQHARAEFFVEDGRIRAEIQCAGSLPQVSVKVVADGVELPTTRTLSKRAGSTLQISNEYAFAQWPRTITLSGPAPFSIDFVLYDRGLPVNDRHLLPASATVDLDREDGWFSKFRNPDLRRRLDAPVHVFLSVSPYAIRKEIVARLRDLQQWVDLGLRERAVLPIEEQETLMQKAAVFLRQRAPTFADGERIDFEVEHVDFVSRVLSQPGIVDPPRELPLSSATLRVVLVHAPDASVPRTVSMRWDLFGHRVQAISAVAMDAGSARLAVLTPEDDELIWTHTFEQAAPAGLDALSMRQGPSRSLGLAALVLGAVGVVLLLCRRFKPAAVLLGIAIVVFFVPFGGPSQQEVAAALLSRTYRAFNFVGESAVYDALASSVAEESLDAVFLRTRQALELPRQGGVRVTVERVTLESCEIERDGDGFRARCAWIVEGWFGDRGQVVPRRARSVGRLAIAPRDGDWKLIRLELPDSRRTG
jgi:hypothetical protein